MKYSSTLVLAACLALLAMDSARARQTDPPEFRPNVGEPAYEAGTGPVIVVDAAHNNWHTADGRYGPFADLLRGDGYVVRGSSEPVTGSLLVSADVFVIANAIAEANRESWTLPTPSAFEAGEIDALDAWVEAGGSLLLIADHMPFPGAIEDLAARFGVFVGNGFAMSADSAAVMHFRRSDGSLRSHVVTDGRYASERIESVKSLAGQAFRVAPGADVDELMVLGAGSMLVMPQTAWQFGADTPHVAGEGLLQGAVLRHGAGRVAVFGEAAMFTVQAVGNQGATVGMSDPDAPHNAQFLLNVMHWLTGALDAE